MAINFPASPTTNQTYTYNGRTWTWNGVGWQATGASGLSVYTKTDFTATAAQTTFTVAYTVGFVDVYYNGSKLSTSEYTATNGTSVVLGTACAVNDIVETIAWTVSTTLNPALGVATATSLAIGGATIGTNALAVTGTTALSGLLTAAGGVSSTLTTDATSASTGSIITAGGISTQKALWVGTTANVAGTLTGAAANFSGNVTSTTGLFVSASPIGLTFSSNTLVSTGGTSGFQWNNNANSVALMNLTNAGVLKVGGSAGAGGVLALQAASPVDALSILRTGIAEYSIGIRSADNYLRIGGYGDAASGVVFYNSTPFFGPAANNAIDCGASGAAWRSGYFATSIGIGMTPSNVLDITQNQNGGSIASLLNSNGGTGAYCRFTVNNGTSLGAITQVGSGYTTSGVVRQNGTYINANGAGGLTLATEVAQPIYFGINNAEKMRLDASGNLCIGNTSTSYKCAISGILNVGTDAAGSGGNGQIVLNSANSTPTTSASPVIYHRQSVGLGLASDYAISFEVNGGTSRVEAARFDNSGNLLVGAASSTAAQSGGIALLPSGNQSYVVAGHVSGTGSGSYYLACYYNAVLCGGVTQSGTTGVALTTISDYRLKDNVKPMTEGLNTITSLKPVTYDWISDKSSGEGFIAHELQAVIPTAVMGEKDAVDENGSIKPQGVDFSKIVPHLVAAIQELTTRLAALESK